MLRVRYGAVLGLLTGLAMSLSLTDLSSAQSADRSETTHLTLETECEVNACVEEQTCWPFWDSLPDGHCGVSLEPVYTGEVFTNARGGRSTRQATRYLGLLDLLVAFDFERMGLAAPGQFVLLAQHTHGQGLTEDFVGDTQVLSNIDPSTNLTQVSEYWWEVDLLEDTISLRLGKQDINTEFLLIEAAEGFIHSTFGLSPSTAFPTYPDPSMGAVVLVQLNAAWHARVGLWDAFSLGGNWGFSGNDSVLVIGELEYNYALAGGSLPGKLTIGAVYESAGQLSGVPISAVREYILQLEQVLYREHPCDQQDAQGLAIFGGYYPRFPGRLVTDESIGHSLVAGLVSTGLIPQRDEDVLGAGVVWAELFQGGTGQETVFEVFYQARVTSRVTIQPDLQYIASPSGIFPDAVVIGLRFQMTW